MQEQSTPDFASLLEEAREWVDTEDDLDDIAFEVAFGRRAQAKLRIAEAERDALLQVIREAKSSLLDARARAAIKEVQPR